MPGPLNYYYYLNTKASETSNRLKKIKIDFLKKIKNWENFDLGEIMK